MGAKWTVGLFGWQRITRIAQEHDTKILWIPISLISKVFNDWIRYLEFNPYLH